MSGSCRQQSAIIDNKTAYIRQVRNYVQRTRRPVMCRPVFNHHPLQHYRFTLMLTDMLTKQLWYCPLKINYTNCNEPNLIFLFYFIYLRRHLYVLRPMYSYTLTAFNIKRISINQSTLRMQGKADHYTIGNLDHNHNHNM